MVYSQTFGFGMPPMNMLETIFLPGAYHVTAHAGVTMGISNNDAKSYGW